MSLHVRTSLLVAALIVSCLLAGFSTASSASSSSGTNSSMALSANTTSSSSSDSNVASRVVVRSSAESSSAEDSGNTTAPGGDSGDTDSSGSEGARHNATNDSSYDGSSSSNTMAGSTNTSNSTAGLSSNDSSSDNRLNVNASSRSGNATAPSSSSASSMFNTTTNSSSTAAPNVSSANASSSMSSNDGPQAATEDSVTIFGMHIALFVAIVVVVSVLFCIAAIVLLMWATHRPPRAQAAWERVLTERRTRAADDEERGVLGSQRFRGTDPGKATVRGTTTNILWGASTSGVPLLSAEAHQALEDPDVEDAAILAELEELERAASPENALLTELPSAPKRLGVDGTVIPVELPNPQREASTAPSHDYEDILQDPTI